MYLLQSIIETKSTLTYSTVILSVLGSGALSAWVTFLATTRLKKVDYKIDYRKYVLRKRQVAYDDIEKLLIRLDRKKRRNSENKRLHSIFIDTTSENNPIHDFLEQLTETLSRNNFWITSELHDKLVGLLHFLMDFPKAIGGRNFITAEELEEIGAKSFEYVEKHRLIIFEQFFEDLKTLDEVEKFKKSKRKF